MKRWRRRCACLTICLVAGASVAYVSAAACVLWSLPARSTPLERGRVWAPVGEWPRVVPESYIGPTERWESYGFGFTSRAWSGLLLEGGQVTIARYRGGWPMRAVEFWQHVRWQRTGDGIEPESGLAGGLGIPPKMQRDDRRPPRRIPLLLLPLGFAINTLFYTTIVALPLSVFPLRRHLRARRGRCPKCGYDLTGLGGAAKGGDGGEGGAPCPECGAAR